VDVLAVIVEVLVGIVNGDGGVAVKADLHVHDVDAADQPRGKRLELREQLALGNDRAVLVHVQHGVVEVASPHVGVARRNRIVELLRHALELCGDFADRLSRHGGSDNGASRVEEHDGAGPRHSRSLRGRFVTLSP
jgi:hypothetical protein